MSRCSHSLPDSAGAEVAREEVKAALAPPEVDHPDLVEVGQMPVRVIGLGSPSHALALTSAPGVSEAGPFPGARGSVPLPGTMAPSDSRCAPLNFTTGLYERSLLTRLSRRASPVPGQPLRTCRPQYPGGTWPGACPDAV
jgi:hypothetical protein